jgi:hypothetical protein
LVLNRGPEPRPPTTSWSDDFRKFEPPRKKLPPLYEA